MLVTAAALLQNLDPEEACGFTSCYVHILRLLDSFSLFFLFVFPTLRLGHPG